MSNIRSIAVCLLCALSSALQIDYTSTLVYEPGEEETYTFCRNHVARLLPDAVEIGESGKLDDTAYAVLRNWQLECLLSRRVWAVLSKCTSYGQTRLGPWEDGKIGYAEDCADEAAAMDAAPTAHGANCWERFWEKESYSYSELVPVSDQTNPYVFWRQEIPALHTLFTAADVAFSGGWSTRLTKGPTSRDRSLIGVTDEDVDAIMTKCYFTHGYIVQYVERANVSRLGTAEYIQRMLEEACRLYRNSRSMDDVTFVNAMVVASDKYVVETYLLRKTPQPVGQE